MTAHLDYPDRSAHNGNISINAKDDNMTDHLSTYASTDSSKNMNNSNSSTAVAAPTAPLHIHVERAVREYFMALEDEIPTDLYELILMQVELPLLTVVLEQTRGNQTKCAQILGLNRGTLRKKLKTYNLMN